MKCGYIARLFSGKLDQEVVTIGQKHSAVPRSRNFNRQVGIHHLIDKLDARWFGRNYVADALVTFANIDQMRIEYWNGKAAARDIVTSLVFPGTNVMRGKLRQVFDKIYWLTMSVYFTGKLNQAR